MIKIIDTYSNGEFDPVKWKAEGYSGVIMKAGQGMLADVPRVHPDWAKHARDAGLLTGWYWVCDSRYHSTDHVSAMEKYNLFADIGKLGLWIDVEKPKISMSETMYWKTPYAGYKNLVDLVYLLEGKGMRPGIYTSPGGFALVCRDAPKEKKDYLARLPLWTAQYYDHYDPNTSKPELYGSWIKWTWWQYREGPDVNIFNGTDEEFKRIYGDTTIPPVSASSILGVTVKLSDGTEVNLK